MIRVEFQNPLGLDGLPRPAAQRCEVPLHLQRNAALCRQADGVAFQFVGELCGGDFSAEAFFDKIEEVFILGLELFRLLLLVLCFDAQVVVVDRAEFLVLKLSSMRTTNSSASPSGREYRSLFPARFPPGAACPASGPHRRRSKCIFTSGISLTYSAIGMSFPAFGE